MTTFNIPVPATTDAFTQSVQLDGVIYDMSFRWNPRDGHWFMDMKLAGVEVISGYKLVTGQDLLDQDRRIDNLPPGQLYLVDLDGLDRDPDETLFGTRVLLRYESVDD